MSKFEGQTTGFDGCQEFITVFTKVRHMFSLNKSLNKSLTFP